MSESEFQSQRSLVIAGMHRSLTSIVTESLQGAGLFIGDDLIGANASNAHGHFESRQIVDFHLDFIRKYELSSWWYMINAEKAKEVAMNRDFGKVATSILQSNFNGSLYGWKDPRSAFFLEGWNEVLHDPYYIIVFRHPVSCVDSLLRRSLKQRSIKYIPLLAQRYFNLWKITNQCLLDFASERADRCYFIHTPNDLINQERTLQLNEYILNRWNLPLDRISFTPFYDAKLMSSSERCSLIKMSFNLRKDVQKVYSSLLEKIDDQDKISKKLDFK